MNEVIPDELHARRILGHRVRTAIREVLNVLKQLGAVDIHPSPPLYTRLTGPAGLMDIYGDWPCPWIEESRPSGTVDWTKARVLFVPCQTVLNQTLPVLACALVPVAEVLSKLGIEMTPWLQLQQEVDGDVAAKSKARHEGIDLLLEDDGYLAAYCTKEADALLFRRNTKRIERLIDRLNEILNVLVRVGNTVLPGAVWARLQVATVEGRSLVTLDGAATDVTSVPHAGTIFRLLREADGQFVPADCVEHETGMGQFKPAKFLAAVGLVSRTLHSLLRTRKAQGTRIVVPLSSWEHT